MKSMPQLPKHSNHLNRTSSTSQWVLNRRDNVHISLHSPLTSTSFTILSGNKRNEISFSKKEFSIMDAYTEMIRLSSRFFQIIGMGMFNLKWHPWRVFIIMGYQFLSIISNGFVSMESFSGRDINVFSTCIVILSATALVVVKIMILLFLSKEFNSCFRWIEMCYCEKFYNQEVDEIWAKCYNRCSQDTLFYTRWF